MSKICKLALYLVTLLLVTFTQAESRQGWKTSGDPEIDKWFHDQMIPNGTQRCCDVSDGSFVEEDIRNGKYWIRWEKTQGAWIEVPDSAVIDNQPNKWGAPAVWWGFDEDASSIYIKCYIPGAKA